MPASATACSFWKSNGLRQRRVERPDSALLTTTLLEDPDHVGYDFMKSNLNPQSILSAACVVLGLTCSGCATTQRGTGREELLALPYQQFDQMPASGWRSLSDRHQYGDAARLIEAYLTHHAQLPEDQGINLHFHAAQLFAFAGDVPNAIAHLDQAQYRVEPPAPLRWNDYIVATKAFLENDRASLLGARERIASGPTLDGKAVNLNVVDSLITHFGESYLVAYRGAK
jgi:hypothetical protein